MSGRLLSFFQKFHEDVSQNNLEDFSKFIKNHCILDLYKSGQFSESFQIFLMVWAYLGFLNPPSSPSCQQSHLTGIMDDMQFMCPNSKVSEEKKGLF